MYYKNAPDSNNIIYDEWNAWTQKSKDISFKREGKPGPGENKLGKEFDTKPLGQNFSYDLDICDEKWECKELDKGTFRVGVEVQTKFGELVSSVVNLFDKIKIAIPNLLEGNIKETLKKYESDIYEKAPGQRSMNIYDGFKRLEVSEVSLTKTDEIIPELIRLIDYDGDEKKIELYSPLGEKKNYCIEDAYELLRLDNLEPDFIQEKLGDDYNLAVIRSALKQLEKFKTKSLKIRLTHIVRDLFSDKILVIVDEKLGYRPVKNLEPLTCNRITMRGPRCRYNLN